MTTSALTPGTASTSLKLRSAELRRASTDYILLDGSSSILPIWHELLAATDIYLESCRSQHLATFVNMTIFSGQGEFNEMAASMDEWPKLSECQLRAPGGMTALYDVIVRTGAELHAAPPKQCSVLVATDGEDTASHADALRARKVLAWMRAMGWQVTLIGCDFNNENLSHLLGSDMREAISCSAANVKAAMKALADKRVRHARTGEPIHWSSDEHSKFGGYLTGPKK